MSAAAEQLSDPAQDDHARQMDAIYALQRHVYDATRKYYLLGRDLLIERLAVPPAGHVLEVGCGTARNMALAARRYPSARIYGFDISAEMLKSAERTMQRRGGKSAYALGQADAACFDGQSLFGRASFDRIFCSYTLSMIPEWRAALERACRQLAEGGELHVVDFGQQDRLPRWFGGGLKAWLARFHVEPRAELFEIGCSLAQEHGLTFEGQSLCRDYARYMVLRRN